jgi:4-hydroxy-tetrahydrodipicolinate synthase
MQMFECSGLYTAIITPFTKDGVVDEAAFLRLVDAQIAGGVQGIVVSGSTGEGATTTLAEKERLWSIALERGAGRVQIIAGTGSNDTQATIEATRVAEKVGVGAVLIVTPYYNKPTPSGLLAHHAAIADASPIPQILYNVPARTGTNMSAETQIAIAEAIPSVIATKEASANLEQMSEIFRNAPSHFSLIAGDDSLALPIIALGGVGVIAVISNYAPVTFGALVQASLAGDFATAREHQATLMPWYKANFLESNPLPVKYIMHKLHGIELAFRLPLMPPTDVTKALLDQLLTSTLAH